MDRSAECLARPCDVRDGTVETVAAAEYALFTHPALTTTGAEYEGRSSPTAPRASPALPSRPAPRSLRRLPTTPPHTTPALGTPFEMTPPGVVTPTHRRSRPVRESSILIHPLPDPHPALRLTAGLPADQALGLRLIALARTAQAVHLFESLQPPSPPPLDRSQAASLLVGSTAFGSTALRAVSSAFLSPTPPTKEAHP